ncbi:MAG TPA: Hsp70 family protein [Trebonia sp.]|jgi:molecular chaperone DnaK (HSP70)|nr:Hsp70 family protein [Trebonia sp.]
MRSDGFVTGTFGIDLGTTNSCIAHIDELGRATVIRSELGEDTIPSVVYFESPRNVLVGQAARNSALIAPDLVARLVKRDMGTSAQYAFHGERHTPETVSALILRELARTARESTGQEVRDVVIAVPAYFGVAEREATRRAGQLAGLTVLDVLAEPVAAAMHYQVVTKKVTGPRHVLVYDLGGGTFDTTVIRLDGDDIKVVCTDGDPRLGGADWDEVIVGYLLHQFAAQHPALRPREDAGFMQDLYIAAERLKKELSSIVTRRYFVRYRGAVTQVELTRDTLEKLTAHLLDRTISVTERTIATARRKGITRFDETLLVGGMTRTPAVSRLLAERLGLAARFHEPELAVAKGAALFALLRLAHPAGSALAGHAITGQPVTSRPSQPVSAIAAATGIPVSEVTGIVAKRVSTVVPRGFGVRTIDGSDPLAMTDPLRARHMIMHLLPANTPLPNDSGVHTFYTMVENQRHVGIEVWEQAGPEESSDLADNRRVGMGMLKNLPPSLPHLTPIGVTFFMSETGLLTVRAVEQGSGTEVEFDLQIGDLNAAGMNRARQVVAQYHVTG